MRASIFALGLIVAALLCGGSAALAAPAVEVAAATGNEALPAEVGSPEARLERRSVQRQRDWERRNGAGLLAAAVAMTGLALAQIVIFIWQLRLMNRSVRDSAAAAEAATAAAKAADLSARAAVSIELPILSAKIFGLMQTKKPHDPYDPPGGTVNDGYPQRYASVGPFSFENGGRTPAILDRLDLGWVVAETLPPVPEYGASVPLAHEGFIAAGEKFQSPYHLSLELSEQEQSQLEQSAAVLWVYGRLRYFDFLETPREYRFCLHYARRLRGNLNPFAFYNDRSPDAYVTRRRAPN